MRVVICSAKNVVNWARAVEDLVGGWVKEFMRVVCGF